MQVPGLPDVSDEITPEEIRQAAAEFKAAYVDSETLLLEQEGDRRELMHFDGDQVMLISQTEMDPFIEHCTRARSDGLVNRRSEFRRIASLPIDFLRLWGRQRGITDSAWYLKREYTDLVLRAAHDPDASKFRTLEGEYRKR